MSQANELKVSLIIPVYNEAQHLREFFEEHLSRIDWPWPVEYVFVDDCSTDGSWDIIESFAKRDDVVTFRKPQNGGKASALKKAIELASGSIIAVQDADFEYDPNDLGKLIDPIVAGRADVVYGSRFHKNTHQVHRTFHYIVNRLLTLLSNVFSGLYLSDMETCYKVFKAEIIKSINIETMRFGFEPEVTAKLGKMKIRLHEYPISYFPRNYIEGKKISWKDGVAALWFIMRFNFSALDPSTRSALPSRYIAAGRQWL